MIESLENTFGELENRESLADAVLSAAKNAVRIISPTIWAI